MIPSDKARWYLCRGCHMFLEPSTVKILESSGFNGSVEPITSPFTPKALSFTDDEVTQWIKESERNGERDLSTLFSFM